MLNSLKLLLLRCRFRQRERDDQPAARRHRWLRRHLWHGGGEPVPHQQQQHERGRQLQAEGDDRLREPRGGVRLAGGPAGGLPLLRLLLRPLRLEGARVLRRQLLRRPSPNISAPLFFTSHTQNSRSHVCWVEAQTGAFLFWSFLAGASFQPAASADVSFCLSQTAAPVFGSVLQWRFLLFVIEAVDRVSVWGLTVPSPAVLSLSE